MANRCKRTPKYENDESPPPLLPLPLAEALGFDALMVVDAARPAAEEEDQIAFVLKTTISRFKLDIARGARKKTEDAGWKANNLEKLRRRI